MATQWKTGAFRSWVAFSVLWLCVAGWVNYGPAPPGPWDAFAELPFPRSEAACREAAKKEASVVISKCIENAKIQNWRDFEKASWTFFPPVALFLIGSLIGWSVSGFKPRKSN